MTNQFKSDLTVEQKSDSLQGLVADVVVSGSIGAIESVRFIRALRRLGCETQVTLTDGGAQFITPMSLAWASGREINQNFSGTASHIACKDFCVVAPASADFVRKVATGILDNPGSALVASYLGAKKPVFVVANMHESLMASPIVQQNLQKILAWVMMIGPRQEEGKAKFPEPSVLADRVSHEVNKTRIAASLFINLGGTRAYIDEVRFIGNQSSGTLGSLIADECYRQGFTTQVVCAGAEVRPSVYGRLISAISYQEMLEASKLASECDAAIFAAAVNDFIPESTVRGKLPSTIPELKLTLKPTEKIIGKYDPRVFKVGFKLVDVFSDNSESKLAEQLMKNNRLSQLVINRTHADSDYEARSYTLRSGVLFGPVPYHSRAEVAMAVSQAVKAGILLAK